MGRSDPGSLLTAVLALCGILFAQGLQNYVDGLGLADDFGGNRSRLAGGSSRSPSRPMSLGRARKRRDRDHRPAQKDTIRSRRRCWSGPADHRPVRALDFRTAPQVERSRPSGSSGRSARMA